MKGTLVILAVPSQDGSGKHAFGLLHEPLVINPEFKSFSPLFVPPAYPAEDGLKIVHGALYQKWGVRPDGLAPRDQDRSPIELPWPLRTQGDGLGQEYSVFRFPGKAKFACLVVRTTYPLVEKHMKPGALSDIKWYHQDELVVQDVLSQEWLPEKKSPLCPHEARLYGACLEAFELSPATEKIRGLAA